MTRDRLAELKVRYQPNSNSKCTTMQSEKLEILDDFLIKVDNTSKLVDKILDRVEQLKTCQVHILSTPNADPIVSSKLDEHMRIVKNLSLQVRGELNSLAGNAQTDCLLPCSGIDRIKAYQHASLLKNFQRVMEEYNRNQLEYRNKCKSRINLQLQIAGADITDQKIEDMLESNNPCVFTDAIMEQTTAAKKSLLEIEARHADIVKLEKSIEEMKEMFAHIALLVDNQGDLIDNIEHNVGLTVDKVEGAKTNVEKAVKTRKKTRKKKIICSIILAVLLLILIISLASVFGLT